MHSINDGGNVSHVTLTPYTSLGFPHTSWKVCPLRRSLRNKPEHAARHAVIFVGIVLQTWQPSRPLRPIRRFFLRFTSLLRATLERQEWLTTSHNAVLYQKTEMLIIAPPGNCSPTCPGMHNAQISSGIFGHSWPAQPPQKWEASIEDWKNYGGFFQQAHWKECDSLQISYSEIAVLFVLRGGKFARRTLHVSVAHSLDSGPQACF